MKSYHIESDNKISVCLYKSVIWGGLGGIIIKNDLTLNLLLIVRAIWFIVSRTKW